MTNTDTFVKHICLQLNHMKFVRLYVVLYVHTAAVSLAPQQSSSLFLPQRSLLFLANVCGLTVWLDSRCSVDEDDYYPTLATAQCNISVEKFL